MLKLNGLIAAAILVLGANSFAVPTKDCPDSITLKIRKLDTLTENEIYRKAVFTFRYDTESEKREVFNRYSSEIMSSVARLDDVKRSVTLTLRERKSGVCEYKAGRIDATVMTKKGKNLMRIDFTPGASAYLALTSLSTDGIEAEKTENRPIKGVFGEIVDSRAGDQFQALLAFVSLDVR